MTEPAIVARELAKTYGGKVRALDSVDFTVDAGEVFAYLGRNGSGKTTTVRILTTLTKPTSGFASVAGLDVAREPGLVRRTIGVTMQEAALDPVMSGREHLELSAGLWGLNRGRRARRAAELLELFGLSEDADRRIAGYSGGMRRRLDIATALIAEPEVLFLDEPTTGLDPQSRRALWDEIRSLRDRGRTVFLTTQYLEEADALADHLAVIDRGTVVAAGTVEALKRAHAGTTVELRLARPADADLIRGVLPEYELVPTATGVRIESPGDGGAVEVIGRVRDLRLELTGLKVSEASLEDVFVALTGTEIAVAANGGGPAS